ncbi:hypothetical protein HELRODRAFT_173978 [Helobdella robusta]|uniref:Uncharacterized protein n=1 Tax=Helobdella robusta TaxID=6412 RepID=T1F7F9_HELRO|nr:hypothetical protein HELRODRAFT_173978 [Helobdella robusta]ESO03095.1 hypothetical protein HELRODRAFT_173978 [Helobdella robusta]
MTVKLTKSVITMGANHRNKGLSSQILYINCNKKKFCLAQSTQLFITNLIAQLNEESLNAREGKQGEKLLLSATMEPGAPTMMEMIVELRGRDMDEMERYGGGGEL